MGDRMHIEVEQRARLSMVRAGIAEMFRSHPMLCGFTVQPDSEIVVECWPPESRSPELCAEIAQTLIDLVDGQPDTAAWLTGRTFARVLH